MFSHPPWHRPLSPFGRGIFFFFFFFFFFFPSGQRESPFIWASLYAYWVRVLFRVQVTESLAGKLLFAARLLPGSPFPLISFSVVAHCSTFSHRNVVVIFTDRRWINSNIDVQMNRPLHSRLIKKAKQQLIRQVAWSEMPWMFRHGHHKYCNILTRCSQIMNIPWIVPASDFSVASFIFMPDSDSVTLQSLEPILLTDKRPQKRPGSTRRETSKEKLQRE